MIHKSFTKKTTTHKSISLEHIAICFRNGCSLITRYWSRRGESAMHESFIVRLVCRVYFEFVHYDAYRRAQRCEVRGKMMW